MTRTTRTHIVKTTVSPLGARTYSTLCGAPRTLHDMSLAHASRLVRVASAGHPSTAERCVDCFNRLLALDFARSEKVED